MVNPVGALNVVLMQNAQDKVSLMPGLGAKLIKNYLC